MTDLTAYLVDCGAEEKAPVKGDFKAVLTKGKVVIGGLMGDRALMQAMKSNEDDTNAAYERAVGRRDAPPNLMAIFTRNLADERRHRAWIEGQIAAMKVEKEMEKEQRTSRPSAESLP